MLNTFIRGLLNIYRRVLYVLFRLNRNAVMPLGEDCSISRFDFDINQGDIVHPCVRYSEKPFKGYHWWLIYTPYYKANSDIENPILCFGISENNDPPTKWEVYSQIIGKPSFGYNSDPTMFFDSAGLRIYWRENSTPATSRDSLRRATYGCVISESSRYDIKNPILWETMEFEDKEVSPAIFKSENTYAAFSMHIRFKHSKLHSAHRVIEKPIQLLLRFLSILEIYNEQACYGIAVWQSQSPDETFKYIKTTKIKNTNKLYRPWHLDVFDHDGKLYSVVQTTQNNADICLAVSDDNESFTMYSYPLITNASIGKAGIYKPTAFVHKGLFYLYYTAQDKDNRSLNKLYLTKLPFDELIRKLR